MSRWHKVLTVSSLSIHTASAVVGSNRVGTGSPSVVFSTAVRILNTFVDIRAIVAVPSEAWLALAGHLLVTVWAADCVLIALNRLKNNLFLVKSILTWLV